MELLVLMLEVIIILFKNGTHAIALSNKRKASQCTLNSNNIANYYSVFLTEP